MADFLHRSASPGLQVVPAGSIEDLCEVCQTYPFAEAGFHSKCLQYESQLLRYRGIPIRAAMSNAERCAICARMAELYNHFRDTSATTDVDLDVNRTNIYPGLSSIRETHSSRQGGLVRLVLQMFVHAKDAGFLKKPTIRYQRCDEYPEDVDAVCTGSTLTDWSLAKSHAYFGRIRPLIANQKLFAKWSKTCADRHGAACMNSDRGTRIHGLRFIDVRRRCIVDGSDDAKYMALSYLWGKAPTSEDTLSTLTAPNLYQPFSLTAKILPRTVEDAIVVTTGLGADFLWVDRLCIKQDDDVDKAKFVPQMHLIYGNAELTIVAAAGADCDAGLPGVRPGSRKKQQKVVTFQGIAMIESLDPLSDTSVLGALLGNTNYNTRGWCYQERMLSFRSLIFTAEQVYWECQEATWCEEAFWESPDHPSLYRHSFSDDRVKLRQPWCRKPDADKGVNEVAFKDLYRDLAQVYSGRRLSFASDTLNAFEGILLQLQKGFDIEFHWALPIKYIEDALAWQAEFGVLTRNTSKQLMIRANGKASHVPFPSWSWVGWIGRASLGTDNATFRELPPIIVFYRIDDNSQLEELLPGSREQQKGRMKLDQVATPWIDASRTQFTHGLLPNHMQGSPLASTILCFWTSVARLRMVYRPGTPMTDEEKAMSHFLEVEQDGYCLSVRNLQTSFVEAGYYDFAIFRRETFQGDIYDDEINLNAFCLTWDDSVAYRVGLVEVKEEQWMRLTRDWRPIVLG